MTQTQFIQEMQTRNEAVAIRLSNFRFDLVDVEEELFSLACHEDDPDVYDLWRRWKEWTDQAARVDFLELIFHAVNSRFDLDYSAYTDENRIVWWWTDANGSGNGHVRPGVRKVIDAAAHTKEERRRAFLN